MQNKFSEIELNEDFVNAFNLMENTNKNIFLTGRAGTGKSTLLSYFRYKTSKRIVVLAPTGVSALNIKGQTIHSFFDFKPNITESRIRKKKTDLYKKIDCIIIDEISMVRADLLDCVDKFLRLNGKDKSANFGGIQMILIGDLYQLPPVITENEKKIFQEHYETPYFFSSKVFKIFDFDFIELNKIYRQKDNIFINLLNIIRSNSIKTNHLALLNDRYNKENEIREKDFYINLTTTNKKADEINLNKIKEIKSKEYVYNGLIKGDFDNNYLPTDNCLRLKKGAQVMLLNNDSNERWVNGSVGKIKEIIEISNIVENGTNEEIKNDLIIIELEDGKIVEVEPYKWDIFNYVYNDSIDSLESKPVGSFVQYPIKLAWAITIHKSQGKTFDKVLIDFGNRTFAHGQVYVALSRCVSLDGIILKTKIKKEHILLDKRVVEYIKKLHKKNSDLNLSKIDKIKKLNENIDKKNITEIIYIKNNGDKIKKEIVPISIIEKYKIKNQTFDALKCINTNKKEIIIFDIERILKIRTI